MMMGYWTIHHIILSILETVHIHYYIHTAQFPKNI